MKVLVVGAGLMAREYVKVLKDLETPFTVIGRSEENLQVLKKETDTECYSGGVEAFARHRNLGQEFQAAIVAVTADECARTVEFLMDAGIRWILAEKPLGFSAQEAQRVELRALESSSNIFVGYNRRFYASTRKLRELLREDGGIRSIHFEFTEWSHQIEKLPLSERTKKNWIFTNSCHVIDLAFFLSGVPTRMASFKAGSLPWHPSGSIFTGSGVTTSGALFSYHANWESAGRWGVEALSLNRRLILRPLESLQIQKKAEIAVNPFPIDNDLDVRFKPGIFLQTKTFLNTVGELSRVAGALEEGLLPIGQHRLQNEIFERMLQG